MTTKLDLTPSLEKIGRAERKLSYLEATLNQWIANRPRCSIRREEYNHRAHIIARIEDPLPSDLVWEIVEAVGHIRSALDKMLVAIVTVNGCGVSGVGFPFGGITPDGKPERFPTGRHDALKKKLTPDQWKLVLAQEPYPGGNDLLWAVNEIANEDKHRKSLVRVVPVMLPQNVEISDGHFVNTGANPVLLARGGDADFVCPDQERESVLMSYAFGPGSVHPQIQINQTISLEIVFGPIRPVTGKEVLSTLSQQIRLVKGIVETFANAV